MKVDVLFLPSEGRADSFVGRAVAVFDVLRATTTMTAALAAGVSEIRLFSSIDEVVTAGREQRAPPRPMLCGERYCLRPEGFDLGNSPCEMVRDWPACQTLLMCTTNGTKAIIAAREAKLLLAAALVNAKAVARELVSSGLDVTLLCAGLKGDVAMEDVIGAGAVLSTMGDVILVSDRARMAGRLFEQTRDGLRDALAESAGGRNVLASGLGADIDFAASLNRYDVVGHVDVDGGGLRARLRRDDA
jgi:2-phosphosulfolactate phosphatase